MMSECIYRGSCPHYEDSDRSLCTATQRMRERRCLHYDSEVQEMLAIELERKERLYGRRLDG